MIDSLLKYREDLINKIEELNNLPDNMVLLSSDPNEKDVNDVIKSFEGSIKLVDMTIEAWKKLYYGS